MKSPLYTPPLSLSPSELADKLAISSAAVVTTLFKKGVMSAPNQLIAFNLVKVPPSPLLALYSVKCFLFYSPK